MQDVANHGARNGTAGNKPSRAKGHGAYQPRAKTIDQTANKAHHPPSARKGGNGS